MVDLTLLSVRSKDKTSKLRLSFPHERSRESKLVPLEKVFFREQRTTVIKVYISLQGIWNVDKVLRSPHTKGIEPHFFFFLDDG